MFINEMIPAGSEKEVRKTVVKTLLAERRTVEYKIPKVNLAEKHLSNARLLINREELVKLMPKHGIVAELGVDEGEFSELIIQHNQPKKLHLVDIWANERYSEEQKIIVEEKFKDKIASKEIEINLGKSLEMAKVFSDDYLDWVYIDTTHTYEMTIAELEAYESKVKPGGFIAGHDFTRWDRKGFVRFGVIEAVCKFCDNFNWEIVYLTMELDNNPSFALRKISE